MLVAGFLFVIGGIAALYFLKFLGFFVSTTAEVNDSNNREFADFVTKYRTDESQIQALYDANQRHEESKQQLGWKYAHRDSILTNNRIKKLVRPKFSKIGRTSDKARREELTKLYKSIYY